MDFKEAVSCLVSDIQSYNKNLNEKLLREAFEFGRVAHDGQTRSNGDPYYSHCVAVAKNLAGKKMDTDTIITALLHDTVEDTKVNSEEITKLFGQDVANLVAGVTKLEALENISEVSKQAKNFRKLLLAMSEDIRVLLVKLSDRLHNIQTLHHIAKPEKRIRIATETMEIHVPLAELIGIRDWKEEMEDICFNTINPDAHSSIVGRLKFISKEQGDNIVTNVVKELDDLMTEHKIKNEISGRKKTPYSIWRKMQKKDIGFEQLSDIMAFRIVVDSVDDCYRVLGLIHATYRLVPGRFKDYISLPKKNNYRSLHTGVIGPAGQRVEIQIRTKEMHEFAELGVAAHWSYKSGDKESIVKEGKNYRWLRELLEIVEHSNSDDEVMSDTKMEMYAENVFVFSPKGDIVNLPKMATPIDFAYSIHSGVGNKTIGARINGKVMPLKTELKNGDQVEIITQSNAEPKEAWKNIVVSGKARSAIRRFIRNKRRDEYVEHGKSLLMRTFKSAGFDLTEKDIKFLTEKYDYKEPEMFFVAVGDGTRGVNESLYAVHPEARETDKKTKETPPPELNKGKVASKGKSSLIGGLPDDMVIRFPKCCHAIPGDKIVGVVSTGQGISIHNVRCKEVLKEHDIQNSSIDLYWRDELIDKEKVIENVNFVARINVLASNKPGALNSITTVILNLGVNLSDLKIVSRSSDFWDVNIDLEVKSVGKLTEVMASLRMSNDIISVTRL
ncbi:MAG: RelA/SpoT family protein [Alphaproteobacteria bacterium]